MRFGCAVLTLAALLFSHPAVAQMATPRIAGKYAYMEFTQCAAAFSTSTQQVLVPPANSGNTANVVGAVTQNQVGILAIGVGSITFTPTSATSGTATGSETSIVGGSLAINNSTFNMQSEPSAFSDVAYDANIAAGTLTFGTKTYTMTLGGIDATGLVHTGYLVAQTTNTGTGNSNCVDALNVTRESEGTAGVPVLP